MTVRSQLFLIHKNFDMKLYINDKTNSAKPLYYQSLILLFLPCEKFGENDTSDNELHVYADTDNQKNRVHVKLIAGDRVSEKSVLQDVDKTVYCQMKNLIGRTILDAAKDIFGMVPPWGISTGVKPVKLARRYVRQFGTDTASEILCNEYRISKNKALMAVHACRFEDELMKNFDKHSCSLYISIPFCPTKCNYCSFTSCATPRLFSLIPDYLLKLEKELLCVAQTVKELGMNVDSVYVGGGTPAILAVDQIDNLLSCVYSSFDINNNAEVTFEAGRPDCITKDKLNILKDYGISRVSINTQTTNDNILKAVGRSHSRSDYFRAMECAKNIGFKCTNTDIIAGLPGESGDSFRKTVQDVASLEPENVTVHAFTLKKSSTFRINGENSFDTNELEAFGMTDFSAEYLCKNGYMPYYVYKQKNTVGNLENVGYSKKGFESVYNVVMMGEYHTVFGVGAGSVTKIVLDDGERIERLFAPKYPYEFLDNEKYRGFDKSRVLQLLNER